MSIAVRGNYTAVRRPAAAGRVSTATATGKAVRRSVVLGIALIGLLCSYGYVYSTTLFLERQIELNRTATQEQLQRQELLLLRDAKLTSPDHVRAAAATIGMVANSSTVIGTLDSTH